MGRIGTLTGRILISIIFLMAGLSKIGNFNGTAAYMAAYGMPLTPLFAIGAIIVEIAGGLSLLLGYMSKFGAILLFIFMIPATLIFHTNFGDQMQVIHFMKNLAIMGGLSYIAACGPGELSLDSRLKRQQGHD